MSKLDTHELAWAAGFFDGEGHTSSANSGKYPHLRLTVGQTDIRPLKRFQRAVANLGIIRARPSQNTRIETYSRKDFWVWSTSTFEVSQAVIVLLWNYLSEPKKEQAVICLNAVIESHRITPRRTDFNPNYKNNTKICSKCFLVKALSEFYICVRNEKPYIWSCCKGCVAETNRRAHEKYKINLPGKARGEHNGSAVLTEHYVALIRWLHAQNISMRKMAHILNVDKATVRNVITGHTWKYMTKTLEDFNSDGTLRDSGILSSP